MGFGGNMGKDMKTGFKYMIFFSKPLRKRKLAIFIIHNFVNGIKWLFWIDSRMKGNSQINPRYKRLMARKKQPKILRFSIFI